MTDLAPLNAFGVLTEPATLTIQRLVPGPVERVWAYLTDDGLRRRWLAAGVMEMKVGAPVELVWRNDELTDPPGRRPEGFAAEQRMQSQITELDPPRRLAITWAGTGQVSFDLEPIGGGVLLTLTHRRLPDRDSLLTIGAGWHMHLDLLEVLARGTTAEPFWDGWARLRREYDRRMPA
jgi:uncharacterized protein YndB with AHSA1/START domain